MELYIGPDYNHSCKPNTILYYASSEHIKRKNYILSMIFRKSLFETNGYKSSIVYFNYISPDLKWKPFNINGCTVSSSLFNNGDNLKFSVNNNKISKNVTGFNTIEINKENNNIIKYIDLKNNNINFAIISITCYHFIEEKLITESSYFLNFKNRGTIENRINNLCSVFRVNTEQEILNKIKIILNFEYPVDTNYILLDNSVVNTICNNIDINNTLQNSKSINNSNVEIIDVDEDINNSDVEIIDVDEDINQNAILSDTTFIEKSYHNNLSSQTKSSIPYNIYRRFAPYRKLYKIIN
jgi:hypothetical protein